MNKDKTYICKKCKKEFKPKYYRRDGNKFCSNKCNVAFNKESSNYYGGFDSNISIYENGKHSIKTVRILS